MSLSQSQLWIFLLWSFFVQNSFVKGTIDNVERVHFKIHLPEIVNHQIHTKLVYLHPNPNEYEPQPNLHPFEEENYAEQWSSWDNNGNIGGHHRSKLQQLNGVKQPEDENYTSDEEEDFVGHNYPPQYEDEVPHNNIESYREDSYRQGLHSESGHLITNNQNDFYDHNQEEADLMDHGYYQEEHDKDDHHSHNQYHKEIGREDRVTRKPKNFVRKFFFVRMIPR